LFPDCRASLGDLLGTISVIISYSVLHYVFVDSNVFDFVDLGIELLDAEGEFLIGDIPNQSKRTRFFSTEAGIAYHRNFTGTDSLPTVEHYVSTPGTLDDSVLMGLIGRTRASGAEGYLMPQHPELPMANRREDILIRRPR
jgi:hypothetical protein